MPNPTDRARLEGGFSLLELLVAMLVAVEVLVAAGMAFDLHNRMAVIQTQVTDLQQSLRISQFDISRLVRMAGRGGLPADFHPEAVFDPSATPPALGGQAIEVRDNVTDASDRHIARGDTNSPEALEGTDILTVRGCFSGSVYQLQPNAFQPGDSDGDGVSDGNVTFTIDDRSAAGIHQALGPLIEQLAVANSTPFMIFMSPVDRQTYGVGRVTGFSPTSGTPSQMQITVNLDTNSPLNPLIRRNPPFNDFVRGVPGNMTAALTCMLEEYRFYIREEHEIPGDATTPLRPRLTRARFEPGTENAYANDPQNFSLDLADGVFDLQVALGLDTDYPATDPTTPGSFDDDLDYIGVDDTIFEGDPGTAARNQDDWLFNSPGDDPNDTQYRIHGFTGRAGQPVHLYFVRVTTIARTQRPDPNYQAPDFDSTNGTDLVEDHDYDQAPANQFKTTDARKFRRRMLTTIVDMRNI